MYTGSAETWSPVEVVGPSADTARRWVCQLLGQANERWLLQCCPQADFQGEDFRARTLALARSSCLQPKISPGCFPVLLQRAYLSNHRRYDNRLSIEGLLSAAQLSWLPLLQHNSQCAADRGWPQ